MSTRTFTPPMRGVPPEARLWGRTALVGNVCECWEWMGAKDQGGYGLITVDGRSRRPHRLAYESTIGPIPSGLHLDHLCRNRSCCNPFHLEPVTNRENARRGLNGVLHQHLPGCKNGHPFPENLWVYPYRNRLYRICRECRAVRQRKNRDAKRRN